MADDTQMNERVTLLGAVGAALGTAVCCLGPVLLVSLGVGGAWIGHLSALEPYRPVFMAVAAGLLGLSFYRVYAGSAGGGDCDEGEACEVPEATRVNRLSVWAAAFLVAGLFATPYLLSPGVADATASQTTSQERTSSRLATVTLEIEGMTCGGCARSVQTVLGDLEGVDDAAVTYEPPRARVTYDPSQIDVAELTETTAEVGYPSTQH